MINDWPFDTRSSEQLWLESGGGSHKVFREEVVFSVQVVFFKLLMLVMKVVLKFIPDARPTVFSGEGSAVKLAQTIGHFGHKKVLVVTDAMLVKLGVIDPVIEGLKARGIEPVIYDGIQPDPTFSVVEEGLKRLRSEGCDSVLAIGGGSSMDAAKVMALAASNQRPPQDFEGKFVAKKPALPLFAIPTTAGTGSEVTAAAVISDTEENAKKLVMDPKIVPLAAALDPTLMAGLPPQITAATGMDALTHAIEAYISRLATDETDAYARAATRMIINNLETAYEDGGNMAAREAMALGSFYAGMAFTRAFVGYVHAIAHQFGGLYHTPHGLANAVVLPHVLEYSKDHINSRLADLALECELGQPGESESQLAQKFIDKVWAMNQAMGIPRTLDALKREDIPTITKAALFEAHFTYPVPKYMDKQQCQTLLNNLLTA
ncbi:iron-containing alcohol dehydrogenase [Pseudomaricurvus alkylphenolicus]|nr:iron-containing alcohol dehydrogenase [Pseudomaricurvus alkylphenolicus]